ncbi:hypothetical protein GPECTOR_18g17 [Gonium pectorale]|uniref:Uncharacterized protein n=1 Tax=Gonium pectorale TaxID=33097 RepID=A0A150GJN6_GONPE|nr:hypothetical protein GPECTOR_18g17 [Gonium pectorale]|eukprot:KXZ50016.1 hypothetical protein GPECTOR_18g17 [Gonium pectorale]
MCAQCPTTRLVCCSHRQVRTDGAETCLTCLADCGFATPGGALTCCGDGVCSEAAFGETYATCPSDCPKNTCNKNKVCEWDAGERCVGPNSPGGGCSDCGACSVVGGPYCGDGVCTSRRRGYREDCFSCIKDCGSFKDEFFCGDGICSTELGETDVTCARDCGEWRLPPIAPGTNEWEEAAAAAPVGEEDYPGSSPSVSGQRKRRSLRRAVTRRGQY